MYLKMSPCDAIWHQWSFRITSGNGLWPVRRRAINWTNAYLLSIRPLGIHFSGIWIHACTEFFVQDNAFQNGSHFDQVLIRNLFLLIALLNAIHTIFRRSTIFRTTLNHGPEIHDGASLSIYPYHVFFLHSLVTLVCNNNSCNPSGTCWTFGKTSDEFFCF